jgi:hypothetical protein
MAALCLNDSRAPSFWAKEITESFQKRNSEIRPQSTMQKYSEQQRETTQNPKNFAVLRLIAFRRNYWS